jgi:hypothetical protein
MLKVGLMLQTRKSSAFRGVGKGFSKVLPPQKNIKHIICNYYIIGFSPASTFLLPMLSSRVNP